METFLIWDVNRQSVW